RYRRRVRRSGRPTMSQPEFRTPAWYHGLTLTERAAQAVPRDPAADGAAAAGPAGRRLQRWRSQPPVAKDSCFAQRLAMDGLSEEDLLHLLGERIEAVSRRAAGPPSWLSDIAEAFARPPSSRDGPLFEAQPGQESRGFLHAAAPF